MTADLIPRAAAIAVMTDEADRCDDAVKWGGHKQYIANCKAAAYALRSRVSVLKALPAVEVPDRAQIRADALREAAQVARYSCLVPPDGGSPTEDERRVCEEAERRIIALIPTGKE